MQKERIKTVQRLRNAHETELHSETSPFMVKSNKPYIITAVGSFICFTVKLKSQTGG